MNIHQRKFIKIKMLTILAVIVTVYLLFVMSGIWLMETFCINGYLPPFTIEAPKYITDVWPTPKSELSLNCYTKSLSENIFSLNRRGIMVTIKTDGIAEQLIYDSDHGAFPNRVSLYVDGEKLPTDTENYSETGSAFLPPNVERAHYTLSTSYSFTWAPSLKIGNHTAKLTIVTQSGELLEYEWDFYIK